MSIELDDALASGDEQAIEEALANAEVNDDVLFDEGNADEALPEQEEIVTEPVQDNEITQEVVDEQTSDKNDVAEDEVVTPTEAEPESSPAEEDSKSNVIEKDGKFFVEVSKDNADLESKNGKHKLPYDLLVNTREENLALKKQLDEQSRNNAKLQDGLDESKRVAELYSKQLGEAGLDPKLLPEQMLQNPELMEEVKKDYPQIGELVEALALQVQQQTTEPKAAETAQQSEAPSDSGVSPFEQTFNETAHLKGWQEEGGEKWEMAKLIDSRLANDPSFENKSHSERFLEIEKRVSNAFGDEAPEPVETNQQPAKTPVKQPEKTLIPNSPTDIGHQGSDLSASSQLMDKDAETMTHQMENMSEAAIEAMLEEVSDFL